MIGSIIGGVAGLAGSIIGGSKASKAAKKANAVLDKQEKDNEAWYNRKISENYMQSAEAQAALSKAREMADEQYKRAAGAAAVSGATDESVALAKRAANDMTGDVLQGIASQSTARKDAIEQQYLNNKQNFANQRISVYNNQATNSTNAGNAALQAGMGLVGADMSAHLNSGKGLFESLFKKKGAA